MHFQKDGLFSCADYIADGDSLEGQLVNSGEPEIAIYLVTYLWVFLIHLLVLREQTGCIAATKLNSFGHSLVWQNPTGS